MSPSKSSPTSSKYTPPSAINAKEKVLHLFCLFKCSSSHEISFIQVEINEKKRDNNRRQEKMELEDTAASHVNIGFPLGLALLFACLLFICGFFCCWLHWKKLQSLFQSSGAVNPQSQIQQVDSTYYPQKPAFPVVMMKQNYAESLPVLMPGDEVPKFIAMACPCQPPKEERITIHVQKEVPSEFCSGPT